MATKSLPDAAYLCECFWYNAETGILTWKRRPREHFKGDHAWRCWNARFPGGAAGGKDAKGYIVICIDDVRYKAHRLIWRMQIGTDPGPLLDHWNRSPSDNRWSNLRLATPSQSVMNQRKRNGLPLPKGVTILGSRYRARADGHHLGMFATPEEAHAAYCAYASLRFGEFFAEE